MHTKIYACLLRVAARGLSPFPPSIIMSLGYFYFLHLVNLLLSLLTDLISVPFYLQLQNILVGKKRGEKIAALDWLGVKILHNPSSRSQNMSPKACHRRSGPIASHGRISDRHRSFCYTPLENDQWPGPGICLEHPISP